MDSRIQLMIVADHIQRDLAAARDARRTAAVAPMGCSPSSARDRRGRWIHRARTSAARRNRPSSVS